MFVLLKGQTVITQLATSVSTQGHILEICGVQLTARTPNIMRLFIVFSARHAGFNTMISPQFLAAKYPALYHSPNIIPLTLSPLRYNSIKQKQTKKKKKL